VDKKIYGLDMDIGTGNPNMWATPIRANGGTLLNSTFTKTTLNDQIGVDSLQQMIDVIQKLQAAPTRQFRADQKLNFTTGNFAMAPLYSGASRSLTKALADLGGQEWDFFTPPIWPKTGKRATQANLQPYIVPQTKRASHDEAVRLAFFMGGDFVQGLVADVGNTAPTIKKLIDSDRYLPAAFRRKISLDGNAYRWGMGSNFEQYTPWRNAVQAEIFKGWDGQLSAKATADSAVAAGDAALAANGVKVG
jgi:ABC-type glycerol-3-phosphate transport system substrate-binding protein